LTRIVFITGQPGIGKTTILLNAIETLKKRGYKVGGMISREIRESGVRIGFEIIDIYTGQRGWLAHVNQPAGPQVSKYRVNLDDLKTIGANSILNAIKKTNVVAIDEIGPMELFSPAFKEAVVQALKSDKPLLGTIHHKAQDALINTIKTRKDAQILEVTYRDRNTLHNLIINKILQSLPEKS
jgi:nucleoside-triphosphatase